MQTGGTPNKQDAEKQLTGWLERRRVRMETWNLELELICWRRRSIERDFPPQHSECSNDSDTHARARALCVMRDFSPYGLHFTRPRNERGVSTSDCSFAICAGQCMKENLREIDLAEWCRALNVVHEDLFR